MFCKWLSLNTRITSNFQHYGFWYIPKCLQSVWITYTKKRKLFLKISNSGYFCDSNSITKIRNQEDQNSLRIFLVQSQSKTWKISNPDACRPPSEITPPVACLKPSSFQTLAGTWCGRRSFRLWNKRITWAGNFFPVHLAVRGVGGGRFGCTLRAHPARSDWCGLHAKNQKHCRCLCRCLISL